MRERDLWPDCGRNDDKKGVTALTLAGQDQWLLWEYYFSNNSPAPERELRYALTLLYYPGNKVYRLATYASECTCFRV